MCTNLGISFQYLAKKKKKLQKFVIGISYVCVRTRFLPHSYYTSAAAGGMYKPQVEHNRDIKTLWMKRDKTPCEIKKQV